MGLNKRLIGAGATASGAITPSENFNIVTYTGDGNVGRAVNCGFKPDWIVWKRRDGSADWSSIDTNRTTSFVNYWNQTYAQDGSAGTPYLTITNTGFVTVSNNNTNINGNGVSYVAFFWKIGGGTTSSNSDGDITSTVQANVAAGISISTYTNNGSNSARVGHGLGIIPKVVLIKKYNQSASWHFMTTAIDGSFDDLIFNDTSAKADSSLTAPTSTTFAAESGGSGEPMICYAFADVDGFSKFGTYTGDRPNDVIVETGFEVGFVMIKAVDATDDWFIVDNKRGDTLLYANLSNAETSFTGVSFLSNGFMLNGSANSGGTNNSGTTFLYMAFAADPDTEAPTLADSFAAKLYTGTGNDPLVISGLNLKPGLVWIKSRDVAREHIWSDIVRGPNKEISSNDNSAEESRGVKSFDNDGFTLDNATSNYNHSGEDYISWSWKADNNEPKINTTGSITSLTSVNAAAGFSIVKYVGTGSNATIGHGLSAAPELVIVKKTSGVQNWMVGADGIGWTKYMELNLTNAAATASTTWNNTAPTTTTVSLGSSNNGNTSGQTYIMYAFHSVSGYQKFGTYVGNGSASGTVVQPGFSPDFVMVKRVDSTSNWGLFDSQRSGTYYQKGLLANTADIEYSSTNVNSACEFLAAGHGDAPNGGFRFRDSGSPYNVSSGTYIYWAVKMNLTPVVATGKMAFLVIAGGGSGYYSTGAGGVGGGGAGGLRTSFGNTSGGGASAESNITLAAGTYTFTVGAGGASSSGSANTGVASSIAATGLTTITSVGGGGGNSGAGGSGGGAAESSSGISGGTGTANQGFDGGDSVVNFNGAGGGGAGAVGGNNASNVAGSGGAGLPVSITGSSVTYAGGGGGSAYQTSSSGGTGGTGGGGDGTLRGIRTTATAGTVNTGSGGGALGGSASASGDTAGGSGVVILRMRTSDYSGSTTGSPTVTTVGDETILKYTGSGTYVHS